MCGLNCLYMKHNNIKKVNKEFRRAAENTSNVNTEGAKIQVQRGTLDFVSFFLPCLYCFVFSAALRNFSTGPSPWSRWMAVPLPLLVCLYIIVNKKLDFNNAMSVLQMIELLHANNLNRIN